MSPVNKVTKSIIILLFSAMTTGLAESQEVQAEKLKDQVPAVKEKNESKHSLYGGAGFGNNMIYLGSALSGNQPFYTGTLTYGYNDKFYLSTSASHLSVFDPFISFATFSASYSHDFNSWLDASANLSRYQVNSTLTDTLFNSFFYGNLSVGADWKILYTNISLGGVIAESSGLYLQVRNSRYFSTKAFFNKKVYLSFDPYVNLMLGNLTSTKTSSGTVVGVSAPFKSSSKSSGQHSASSTVTNYFGLMEVDFGLTVAINAGNFIIEAEPGYVLPGYDTETASISPEGFTLFINLYFKIF